jgi:hypothetical protein
MPLLYSRYSEILKCWYRYEQIRNSAPVIQLALGEKTLVDDPYGQRISAIGRSSCNCPRFSVIALRLPIVLRQRSLTLRWSSLAALASTMILAFST